jgi:phosphopantetheinyl transferase
MRRAGASPHAVGIDLVDLGDPGVVARGPSERFMDRVFAPAERAWLDGREDDPRALWSLWAAKEAVYKVVSALDGDPPPFRHAAFVVAPAPDSDAAAPSNARVRYGGRTFPVEFAVGPETLVALSWTPGEGEGRPPDLVWGTARVDRLGRELDLEGHALESIRAERFRPDEARSVHSLPSALARLALRREAAARLSRPEGSLAVVCPEGALGRIPPRLLGAGEGVAVSLSHHGGWVAWALVG